MTFKKLIKELKLNLIYFDIATGFKIIEKLN